MSARFANQTVWITGASSGIGEALALAFAREGARLVLSSRRASELERVRSACPRPGEHRIVPLDLEHPETFPDLVAGLLSDTGGIDVLVNNGGLSQRGLARDTPLAVERRLMEVDYFGPVALTKAVLPHFIERRSGRIVVVSSVMGYVGTPMRSTYAAAKHALHGYFDSLRAEVHGDGVRVLIACPGYVSTRVSENALTATGAPHGRSDRPARRGITAERCADAILRGLARNREEIAVGGPEVLAIRLKRFLPRLLSYAVRRANFGQPRRS